MFSAFEGSSCGPPVVLPQSGFEQTRLALLAMTRFTSSGIFTYTAATDDLETVWGRWFPQHANAPGAFERFRRGLIAAEDE